MMMPKMRYTTYASTYVCMYVCMYVWMLLCDGYVCYAWMYVYGYGRMYVCMDVCLGARKTACIGSHVESNRVCVCVCVLLDIVFSVFMAEHRSCIFRWFHR